MAELAQRSDHELDQMLHAFRMWSAWNALGDRSSFTAQELADWRRSARRSLRAPWTSSPSPLGRRRCPTRLGDPGGEGATHHARRRAPPVC